MKVYIIQGIHEQTPTMAYADNQPANPVFAAFTDERKAKKLMGELLDKNINVKMCIGVLDDATKPMVY